MQDSTTTITNEEDEEQLKEFCRQLVDLSRYKQVCKFRTGSSVEMLHRANDRHVWPSYGVKAGDMDIDIMWYINTTYVFASGQRIPDTYNGHVVRYYTNGMHAGYAFLCTDSLLTVADDYSEGYGKRPAFTLVFCDSKRIVADPKSNEFFGGICQGPAVKCNWAMKENEELIRIGITDPSSVILGSSYRDIVMSYHSPYWPAEASEWISRERLHGSPSKSVIRKVVGYGCDFVCASHKLSPNRDKGNEWRFSFSLAELIIIRNWTITQIIVYRTLKFISAIIQQKTKERNSESCLCSYYFKTQMMWACEQRPKEFWSEESLVDSVLTLLAEMKDWLMKKKCFNYFMPTNNMMDHLTHTDVSEDTSALGTVSGFPYKVLAAALVYLLSNGGTLHSLQSLGSMNEICTDKLIPYLKQFSLSESISMENLEILSDFAAEQFRPIYNQTQTVTFNTMLIYHVARGLMTERSSHYVKNFNGLLDDMTGLGPALDVTALSLASKTPEFVISVIDIFKDQEVLHYRISKKIVLPIWINNSFIIFDLFFDVRDLFTDLTSKHYSRKIRQAAFSQLSDVYQGLRNHRLSITSRSESARTGCRSRAMQYFSKAVSLHLTESQCCVTDLNFDETLVRTLYISFKADCVHCATPERFFSSSSFEKADEDTVVTCSETIANQASNTSTRLTTKSIVRDKKFACCFKEEVIEDNVKPLYLPSEPEDLPSWFGKDVVIVTYTTFSRDHCKGLAQRKLYRYRQDRSPTVSVSWFISKVYMANFLYTVTRDYKAVTEICDDVINVYKQSEGNRRFSEGGFCILLNNHWAEIYDADIQLLLGFYSLCMYLTNSVLKCSLVNLKICPVQFALYLKVRCAINQWPVVDDKTTRNLTNQYKEHGQPGGCKSELGTHLNAESLGICILLLDRKPNFKQFFMPN